MALSILNCLVVSLATISVLRRSYDAHMLTSRLRGKFRVEEGQKKTVLSASKSLGLETLEGKKEVTNAQ